MSRLAGTATLLAVLAAAAPGSVRAETQPACPDAIGQAQRLILVLSPAMNRASAEVQLYERGAKGWKAEGTPKSAVLGRSGMAWAWTAKQWATAGEPVKTEGDQRTPAGLFRMGSPFGFSSDRQSPYVRLQAGENYCVDDPQSPHYNAVVTKATARGASGEDMGTIPLYRQGLFVDYPTDRAAKAGSCIFMHVWRGKSSSTSGCVALAERDVKDIQHWSDADTTVIAILPKHSWSTLRVCFPGI